MTIEAARHFEGCPVCGKDDGYLNAGRTHWLFCDEHKLRWFIGSNLFSSWQDETEEQQREAWKHVEDYQAVGSSPQVSFDRGIDNQILNLFDNPRFIDWLFKDV